MNRLVKFLTIALCLTAFCFSLEAQTVNVKGVVKDEMTGEPIPYAFVKAADGSGTSTSDVGEFSLKAKPQTDLEISFLGYETKRISVGDGSGFFNIFLSPAQNNLDDVVVVAFGKTTREAFTGSAGVMKSEDLSKAQVSNAAQALAGRVAGLQINNSSSQLGSSPAITIRGVGSISSDTQPLIIVDGMPFDGDLNLINSSDIETMTVLKDAASNALYGARGANGVIMITTKRGNSSDARITLDAKWGTNTKGLSNYKTTNATQFFETYYKMLYNTYSAQEGATPESAWLKANAGLHDTGIGPGYVPYTIPTGEYLILQSGKMNPNAVPGTFHNFNGNTYWVQADDWEKEGLRTGFRQEYNLSASGNVGKVNVYSSLGWLDQGGIQEGSSQSRITARMKLDYSAKSWLKIGGNFNYSKYDYSQTSEGTIGTGTIWSIIKTQAPIYPVYIRDANGRIMQDSYGRDIYDFANSQLGDLSRAGGTGGNAIFSNKWETSRTDGNSFIASGYADINFCKDLKLTVNANAYDYDRRYSYINDPYTDVYTTGTDNGYIYKSSMRTFTYNTQQLLNYSKMVGKHDISALLGHEYYMYKYEDISASGYNFGIDGATELEQLLNKNTDPNTSSSMYNNEGFFFRGMYNYDNKYYASVSFRRDASSRFAKEHRWGSFWSVGGAWIISKENFFNASWVDELKFKASYGSQGNDNIGNFRYEDSYGIVNNNNSVAYQWLQKGTEDITWETNANFNTGFEFSLFKNRLGGSIDYFYRKTSDMLFSLNTPPSVGYTSYFLNMGDMRNSGVELVLNTNIIRTKNVDWGVDFNISHIKNKVLSLPDEIKTTNVEGFNGYINDDQSFVSKYRYFVSEGKSLYTWYLHKYAGTDEETGEALYYIDVTDDAGNVTTETTKDRSKATEYLCGDALPLFQGGLSTSLRIRNFDLSIATTFQLGGKGYDYVYQTLLHNGGQTSSTWSLDMLDAWTPEKHTDIPALRYSNVYSQTGRSDEFLISTSYFSLQNVNFGYTLPKRWTSKINIASIRVYFSGENLWFASARKGFDPRYSIGGYTNSELYSPIRTMSGGLTITL